MLLCQMTRRGPGALKLLWHPDRGGVIPQANGSAFEVLDADPGADQAIEHVFHRLERRHCCYVRWRGDEVWDVADVFIRAVFDVLEFLEQPFNPLMPRRPLAFSIFA